MGNGGMVILQYYRWTFSHTKKICSRLYSIELEFIFLNTNKKSLFELPFGGLRRNVLRTPTKARSKAKICRSRRFSKGVGHFKRKFQTDGCFAHQPLLVLEN